MPTNKISGSRRNLQATNGAAPILALVSSTQNNVIISQYSHIPKRVELNAKYYIMVSFII
jgi:hypothetical protein